MGSEDGNEMGGKRVMRTVGVVVQGLAVAVAWVAFAAGWVKVAGETTPDLALFTISVIAVGLVLVVVATSLWIRHNVNIYKKKGPRRGLRRAEFEERDDFVGRRLVGDWDEAKAARVVIVRVEGDEKVFNPRRGPGDARRAARVS